ncbi:ribose 5-phosphate isomerase B [Geomesophilobacter sediminis]|uniref:Ribose 5-phosphate isomerase B n=1 Tax=Geomesophilobacter sediminis TaxID=2798584 RepID=A0A8J7S8L6_9BACT|nr:ribose 5-phosphate isomerase B [Geomesophilobacter sediminis]MBJ6727627.1 ribose 5-phosphate isomerase B [Geomesophilobacter sediminis]
MIVIASDHGGLDLKEAIKGLLAELGLATEDLGTNNGDSVDYPDFGVKLARQVSEGKAEKGILVCGTGIGMSIVANKFPKIRAALATDVFMATMAKEHNNANILVLGGRVITAELARDMVKAWLDTEFAGGRHQGRLDKIAALEQELGLHA